MAEGCGGSELRLHVQTAHHRKQFRRKDQVNMLSLCYLLNQEIVQKYSRYNQLKDPEKCVKKLSKVPAQLALQKHNTKSVFNDIKEDKQYATLI